MREALAGRDLQTVLHRYLECTGLTQGTIALLIDSDQGTVSKIVNGRRSRFTIEEIESFRDGLHIPGHLLGLQAGPHEMAAAVTVEEPGPERGDVKRREFNRAVLLGALGVSGVLGNALMDPEPPAHVGWDHVRMLEQAIERLEAHDARVGGGHLCDVATWLYERASGWLQHSSYSLEVGDALQTTVGELGAWAGWLAIDANRPGKARNHFHETLLLARTADDHPLEVQVLCYMGLTSIRQDRPREALQMATASQRIAAGWATPRLWSLLHLRAARAYAAMSNEAAFRRELAKAQNRFDAGTHPDDPLFINFVTQGELTGITALSYIDLGKPERASQLFRQIIDGQDQAFQRNASYYKVQLADARLRAGDVTEAAQIGVSAVSTVSALDSGRARRDLRGLRAQTEQHAAAVPVREFIEHYDVTFGREVAHGA